MSQKKKKSLILLPPGASAESSPMEQQQAQDLQQLDRAAHLPDRAFMLPSHAQDHLKPVDREMSMSEAAEALKMLAANILCDRDFIRVLQDADPLLREQVYNEIKPHVGYDDPRPFALMTFETN